MTMFGKHPHVLGSYQFNATFGNMQKIFKGATYLCLTTEPVHGYMDNTGGYGTYFEIKGSTGVYFFLAIDFLDIPDYIRLSHGHPIT